MSWSKNLMEQYAKRRGQARAAIETLKKANCALCEGKGFRCIIGPAGTLAKRVQCVDCGGRGWIEEKRNG